METPRERLVRLVGQARSELGLDRQAAFVRATGLSKSTIHRFEQGVLVDEKTLRAISRTVGWTADSANDVLAGGDPTPMPPAPAVTPSTAASGTDAQSDKAWTELADRLPASFVHELASGKVFATDVQDLTVDGGLRVFTVVIRSPDQEPRSPDQVKVETEAWYRTQRELRQQTPVDVRPEHGESGHE